MLKDFLERDLPKPLGRPGLTDLIGHTIDVGSHSPIKQRNYLRSPKVMEAMVAETDKMLTNDIIEPSASGWSSPVVMAIKPDCSYRFYLDFRKVNEVTKRDAYPLPQMHGILDKLRNARYISKLDLCKGFHQVPLEEASRDKTAFTVPGRGLFQFKRMPFGLRLLDRLIGREMEPLHIWTILLLLQKPSKNISNGFLSWFWVR